MPRGEMARVGDKFTSQNGYHYLRTLTGWRLEHHVIAEKKFHRTIDTTLETIYFIDRNRDNLDPENIGVRPKRTMTREAKIAHIKARIEDLTAMLQDLEAS